MEAGEGNIKVVVRCRPLNSRGKQHFHFGLNLSPMLWETCTAPILTYRTPISDEQRSPAAQRSLFVCRGT